jgi:dienelactone hydrolase
MDDSFRWSEGPGADLRRVRFSFVHEGERVPGLLALPGAEEQPLPLVLIQHPATSSKDDYFVADVAAAWTRHGWACGGVDAPFHGDREPYDPMGLLRDRSLMQEAARRFAGEISATVDHIARQFRVDLRRLGFVGYSMGSMMGLPAVARDGRFKAAAFCLVGEMSPGTLSNDAAALGGTAVRFIGKLSDEIVPRASTESLYAAIPGEKDIRWLPGGHFEIGPDVIRLAEEWLEAKL